MDCHSNHSVFLRSNGSLACWCDAGSNLILKTFDPDLDYSKDVVFGEVYGNIRNKLKQDQMPFPKVCDDCMVLASGACFNPKWETKKEINTFQVESSIACILECPGCLTFKERRENFGRPWHLETKIFEKFLRDFKNDGVTIRNIDFQGHGEPLLNKEVWNHAGLAKSYFPEAKISMCTSAHGKFDMSQIHSGIDEMMFAIDGIDQESFQVNRVHGNFDKAFNYMKSFCHAVRTEGKDVYTIWKYVLFDCNHSPDQLLRAQEMAVEAGVDELLFVNTQLGVRSSKEFTLDDIPKFDSNVKLNIYGFLSNFDDLVHSVDKARYALLTQDYKSAESNLLFAANMVRRRYECSEPQDPIDQNYQAIIYEIQSLVDDVHLDEDVKTTIFGGLASLKPKLDLGLSPAKDMIIRWKSDEIQRLEDMVGYVEPPKPMTQRAKAQVKQGLKRLLRWEERRPIADKDAIIQAKSARVMHLAIQIEQQPNATNSVQ